MSLATKARAHPNSAELKAGLSAAGEIVEKER